MTQELLKAMDGEIFAVWFLIGAAFVFWMQAGFAMCEAGFTRAKNAGNIIMKNLMDFCIGTVMWFICGASLMLGENILKGFAGGFSFDVFTNYGNFNYCIGFDGGKDKVFQLLHLFRSDIRRDLSDRGALDMGRRIPCTVGLSRLCRLQLYPHGRRNLRFYRSLDAGAENREI